MTKTYCDICGADYDPWRKFIPPPISADLLWGRPQYHVDTVVTQTNLRYMGANSTKVVDVCRDCTLGLILDAVA